MNTAVMMKWIVEASPLFKARTAGFFWLLTFLTSSFAMFVGGRLLVSGDAAATAANILAHEALFRSGTASILLVVLLPAQLAGFIKGPVTDFMWLPLGVFEVVLGLWLLIKGVAAQATR